MFLKSRRHKQDANNRYISKDVNEDDRAKLRKVDEIIEVFIKLPCRQFRASIKHIYST